jgi:nucleoid-associated protein YgaU
VQSGENFWTIARLYYGSGRFWKALWAANRGAVPNAAELYVGQTIRIPPPEALDRSLIEPERSARRTTTVAAGSAASTTRRASRPSGSGRVAAAVGSGEEGEVGVELPMSDPFARRPLDPTTDAQTTDRAEPASDRPASASRPVRYRVRPHETLRSIARDQLGDSRRADEILELNAEVIDDPARPPTGQIIQLPGDARLVSGGSRQGR